MASEAAEERVELGPVFSSGETPTDWEESFILNLCNGQVRPLIVATIAISSPGSQAHRSSHEAAEMGARHLHPQDDKHR